MTLLISLIIFKERNIVMTESEGAFTSPNYPEHYGNDVDATYIVNPGVEVELYITYDIESHEECSYDSLKVCHDTIYKTILSLRPQFIVLVFTFILILSRVKENDICYRNYSCYEIWITVL